MATPIVVVASGGLPVVQATNGLGVPVTVATNGYGRPVTIATNGYGMPVVPSAPFVDTGAPANVFTPIVSVVGGGAPIVDEILVCSQGSWTHSPTGYAYQWYRTTATVEEEGEFFFLHSASAGTASDGDTATTAAIDTTGAGLLIVGVVRWPAQPAPTISDSKGNTWHALADSNNATAVGVTIYWSIPTSAGTGHTATAAGTDFFGSLTFAAFSGGAVAPFDVSAGGTGSSNVATAGAGITPTVDDELVVIITGIVGGSNSVSSVSGSFNMMGDIPKVADHLGHGMAYLIQTTAAAVNPSMTWASSGDWAASMASFKYE